MPEHSLIDIPSFTRIGANSNPVNSNILESLYHTSIGHLIITVIIALLVPKLSIILSKYISNYIPGFISQQFSLIKLILNYIYSLFNKYKNTIYQYMPLINIQVFSFRLNAGESSEQNVNQNIDPSQVIDLTTNPDTSEDMEVDSSTNQTTNPTGAASSRSRNINRSSARASSSLNTGASSGINPDAEAAAAAGSTNRGRNPGAEAAALNASGSTPINVASSSRSGAGTPSSLNPVNPTWGFTPINAPSSNVNASGFTPINPDASSDKNPVNVSELTPINPDASSSKKRVASPSINPDASSSKKRVTSSSINPDASSSKKPGTSSSIKPDASSSKIHPNYGPTKFAPTYSEAFHVESARQSSDVNVVLSQALSSNVLPSTFPQNGPAIYASSSAGTSTLMNSLNITDRGEANALFQNQFNPYNFDRLNWYNSPAQANYVYSVSNHVSSFFIYYNYILLRSHVLRLSDHSRIRYVESLTRLFASLIDLSIEFDGYRHGGHDTLFPRLYYVNRAITDIYQAQRDIIAISGGDGNDNLNLQDILLWITSLLPGYFDTWTDDRVSFLSLIDGTIRDTSDRIIRPFYITASLRVCAVIIHDILKHVFGSQPPYRRY